MTNREKYLTEILATVSWAVNEDGTIHRCDAVDCEICIFDDEPTEDCSAARRRWLEAEADKEPKVDWSRVPIDTPIYVRDRNIDNWKPRYFAKYEDGLIHTWSNGATNWSNTGSTTRWNKAKLAKEDEV